MSTMLDHLPYEKYMVYHDFWQCDRHLIAPTDAGEHYCTNFAEWVTDHDVVPADELFDEEGNLRCGTRPFGTLTYASTRPRCGDSVRTPAASVEPGYARAVAHLQRDGSYPS